MLTRRRVAIPGLAAVVLAVFFLVPLVPYSVPLTRYYFPFRQGYQVCQAVLPKNGQPNVTQWSQYGACLATYRYPSYNLTGYGSISYNLLGVGEPPFSNPAVVTVRNTTMALYFERGNLVGVESPLPPHTVMDPPGVVQIVNVSASMDYLGLMNVNVTVRNVWHGELDDLAVSLNGWPAYGNVPQGSVSYLGGGSFALCSHSLDPGDSCRTSIGYVPQGSKSALLRGTSYDLEVRGYYGSTYFAYHATVEVTPHYFPYSVVLPQGWTAEFVGDVNTARSGPPMVENSTLNQFAAVRFHTMISNYNVSHYGYSDDYYQFFHTFPSGAAELYLFPVGYSPGSFTSYLQTNSSMHWEALVNAGFTHYGYYFGTGPAVVAVSGCPTPEIPGPGINVPQYLKSLGCSVAVLEEGWLVIELGP